MDTLHFNNYFIGFVARDYRLDKDSMKGIITTITTAPSINHQLCADGVQWFAKSHMVGRSIDLCFFQCSPT